MLKIIIGKFGRGKIIRFHRLFLRSYCCTDDLQFDKFSRIRGGREIISSRITFFIRSFLKSLNNISFAMNSLFFSLSLFPFFKVVKSSLFFSRNKRYLIPWNFLLFSLRNAIFLFCIKYLIFFKNSFRLEKKREIFFLEIVSLWISVERCLYLKKEKLAKFVTRRCNKFSRISKIS